MFTFSNVLSFFFPGILLCFDNVYIPVMSFTFFRVLLCVMFCFNGAAFLCIVYQDNDFVFSFVLC